ncbi:hypothetical protein K501DRAFT_323748 [Backusella circina FSU 941]|nr:hypothetical protein K501DRAFT_323748 [Backusella circina FSU 941]
MSPNQQSFKTSFWSQKQPELTLPDFYTGYNILHQKLGQSKVENEEFITFLRERINIEEVFANRLGDQGKSSNKSTGFGRDEGAGLKKCFTKLKETSASLCEHHRAAANAISSQALKPFQDFHDDYKRGVANSKQAVDSMLKQFDGLVKEAEKSRAYYHKKCKEADRAEELALKNASESTVGPTTTTSADQVTSPTITTATEELKRAEPSDAESIKTNSSTMSSLQLGNTILSHTEFEDLIRQMKQNIPIGDHRVPILGRYQNTSSGEEIAKWLQHNLSQCKDSPAMADVVAQQLIQPYNVLRLIGQRGNKFVASPTSYYQWRDDEGEGGAYALGGLLDKVTTGVPLGYGNSNGEEPHKKARRDAEKADDSYRSAVRKLDQMRMAIEEALFAHFSEMEQVELQRITQVKSTISSFIECLSESFPRDKAAIEEMAVYQESLKPDQDIQFIVQQYGVSSFSPKAIVYDNYYHGITHDQVFGVPLEELGRQCDNGVPRFVSCILESIKNGLKDLSQDTLTTLWSTPCSLDRVHAACLEFNISSDRITTETFKECDLILLVGILRYFLLEIPECLMTFEFYDPVVAFFGGNDEKDEKLLVPTVSNLIATLPGVHFATLNAIIKNITGYINEYSISNDVLDSICQSLGPIILRPRVETYTTMNSKVPFKFLKDLIKHENGIFSETTLKLHSESEKRRQAKPIVVTKDDIHTIAETNSSDNTDSVGNRTAKRAGSLMSFMRPSVMEDTAKWGMSSVMGVFQRNNNGSVSPEATISTGRPISLSFGSPITQNESPPSSPRGFKPSDDSSIPSAASEVMFDIGEKIFTEPSAEKSDDAILKEVDVTQQVKKSVDVNSNSQTEKDANTQQSVPEVKQEEIDSSFFDDDDDDDE